jgi:type IV pilus biogenesis protein CpaD/CtpE
MIRTLSLTAFAALALGACSSTREIGTYGHDLMEASQHFGDSVRHNIAVQTVNPTPTDTDVTVSGQRAATAVDRYRNDKVEKPAETGTLSIQAQPAGQGGN